MRLLTVILAGGAGSRIGGAKPSRELAGISLLDRTLAFASGISDTVAVAVRDESQVVGRPVTFIRDDPQIEGPLAGLVSALRFAGDNSADAVLTLPTDMPFLPGDLVVRLVQERGSAAAAIAKSGDQLHPVCGLWSVGALDRLPDYLSSSRRSLAGFAECVGYVAVEWPIDSGDPFFNVNTPADLATAKQRIFG